MKTNDRIKALETQVKELKAEVEALRSRPWIIYVPAAAAPAVLPIPPYQPIYPYIGDPPYPFWGGTTTCKNANTSHTGITAPQMSSHVGTDMHKCPACKPLLDFFNGVPA